MSFELVEGGRSLRARIKVVGVGGAGGNAVNNMILQGLEGVEFIAVNTDSQALGSSRAGMCIPIGQSVTRGLGAGAQPGVGRKAAEEDRERIRAALEGSDMVFVTAGLGGGTGTGAAPVVAQAARDCGALTVGVVTKPFLFEGRKRKAVADEGLAHLKRAVDTVITIPNQRLVNMAERGMRMIDAFRRADDVLYQAVKGIADVITETGYINVDFADVRTVMGEMGMALMGTGVAEGPDRAVKAANAAIQSPLLEDVDIHGARGVLINISGSEDLTLHEVNEAATIIQEAAHEEATIIFGQVLEPSLEGQIRVTVIATGFGREEGDEFEAPQGFGREGFGRDGFGRDGSGDLGHGSRGRFSAPAPMRAEPRPAPQAITHAPRPAPVASAPAPEHASRPDAGRGVRLVHDRSDRSEEERRPVTRLEPAHEAGMRASADHDAAPRTEPTGRDEDGYELAGSMDGRPGFDSVSLDQLNGFYEDDLDVPAFMRRRMD